ncbi:MAG TPA: glycosyltransferase family 4 protein [Gaiellaceae bacterium]
MKVLVLTTSYPPYGGSFVASSVELARERGIEVEVVSPASFRHYGIAGGHGIVGNLRARPWLTLLVPLFLWNFRRAARRHPADLVHAHWLVSGLVAATLGRPYVVQPWGTDVALLGRLPWRFPRIVAASRFLADEMGGGAIVPTAVPIPERVAAGDDGYVLFAGRLSPEKGIEEFLAATEGLPRVIVGAGPVRVPEGVGAVADVGPFYERAAVVVVPSRREGYGMVAREAMAHGRPVVASAVGGLRDAIEDGVDGVLVPPRDAAALRAAIERLLGDAELRLRLGAAARAKAEREWSSEAAADALVAVYAEACA